MVKLGRVTSSRKLRSVSQALQEEKTNGLPPGPWGCKQVIINEEWVPSLKIIAKATGNGLKIEGYKAKDSSVFERDGRRLGPETVQM